VGNGARVSIPPRANRLSSSHSVRNEGDDATKYICLVYVDESKVHALSTSEGRALVDEALGSTSRPTHS